jgi:hypothetical protein
MAQFKPRGFVTVYQTGELFGKYMPAASGATAAKGCRATGLFLCYMNIIRPHDFPLPSGNIDAAHMNHPALVKPSISHHSVLIFRRSLLLRLSEHQISTLCQT